MRKFMLIWLLESSEVSMWQEDNDDFHLKVEIISINDFFNAHRPDNFSLQPAWTLRSTNEFGVEDDDMELARAASAPPESKSTLGCGDEVKCCSRIKEFFEMCRWSWRREDANWVIFYWIISIKNHWFRRIFLFLFHEIILRQERASMWHSKNQLGSNILGRIN